MFYGSFSSSLLIFNNWFYMILIKKKFHFDAAIIEIWNFNEYHNVVNSEHSPMPKWKYSELFWFIALLIWIDCHMDMNMNIRLSWKKSLGFREPLPFSRPSKFEMAFQSSEGIPFWNLHCAIFPHDWQPIAWCLRPFPIPTGFNSVNNEFVLFQWAAYLWDKSKATHFILKVNG